MIKLNQWAFVAVVLGCLGAVIAGYKLAPGSVSVVVSLVSTIVAATISLAKGTS